MVDAWDGALWWALAGEWREVAEGVPHGRQEAVLEDFATSRGLRPISVRKATAARAFIERLRREEVVDRPERLASLPFQRVEILKRLARYGDEHLPRLSEAILAGELKGNTLKEEERRIRTEGWSAPPVAGDGHAYRLRFGLFKALALRQLPALYPPPARYAVRLDVLSGCLAVSCDAVVASEKGYVGLRVVAARSGVAARARGREALQTGLTNARVFDQYVFLCQRRAEADGLAALFRTVSPCGVGVSILGTNGAAVLLAPNRGAPADLAVRFYGVFAGLFP